MLFEETVARKKQQLVDYYVNLAKHFAIVEPESGKGTDFFILAESVEACSPEEFAAYFEGTALMES
jgi:hypothetical protein